MSHLFSLRLLTTRNCKFSFLSGSVEYYIFYLDRVVEILFNLRQNIYKFLKNINLSLIYLFNHDSDYVSLGIPIIFLEGYFGLIFLRFTRGASIAADITFRIPILSLDNKLSNIFVVIIIRICRNTAIIEIKVIKILSILCVAVFGPLKFRSTPTFFE